jgi:flagellar motor protein MotB
MRKLVKNIANSEEKDDGYLSSVSDLMSGLLFIFIILLLVFFIIILVNNKEIEAKKESEIQEYKEKLEQERNIYQQKVSEMTDAREIRNKLLQLIQGNLFDKYQIKINIDIDDGILIFPEDILFPSGQADLTAEGKTMLNRLTDELSELLPCYSGNKNEQPNGCESKKHLPGRLEVVLIEGHADNQPVLNNRLHKDNWDLSAARSITTFRYMTDRNPKLLLLTNATGKMFFGTSAYADTRAVATNDTEEGRALNRRVNLRFIVAAPIVENKIVSDSLNFPEIDGSRSTNDAENSF